MVYSSAALSVVQQARALGVEVVKRLETSDPADVNESWLKNELGLNDTRESVIVGDEKKPFARPKPPGRRR